MKLLLIAFMFVFITNITAQQNKIDSLKHELESTENDSIRNKNDNDSLKIGLLFKLAYTYNNFKPDSAIFYARQIVRLAQNAENSDLEIKASGVIAYSFYILGNYPQALALMFRLNEMRAEINDSAGIYSNNGMIGAIYNKQGDLRKAIYYMTLSEQFSIKTNNKVNLQRMYVHKGNAYLKLGMLDSALWYEQKAYELLKANDYWGASLLLNYRGNVYEKLGEDSIALNDYRQSIRYSLSDNDAKDLCETYVSLASFFYHTNNLDSCIFYSNKALSIANSGSLLYFASGAYNLLTDAYKAKRNIDSTFKYLHLMLAAKDSLFSRDRIQQMEFLAFNEEQRKKHLETEQLAYKNKVKIYSLAGGFAVLLLLSLILLRNNKNKQKANLLLNQEKDKVENTLSELKSTQAQLIQSEKMASLGELTAGIAHEIQNPLNFVNNFSEVNKELIAEMKNELLSDNKEGAVVIANDIEQNLEKINHHGKRADAIVKGMLQHSMASTGKKEPTNINALADEYLRLSYHGLRAKDKSFNATIETYFDENIGKIEVIPQDIGRVLLNLFNNAFYAVTEKKKALVLKEENYEPKVSVITKKENDKVVIVVKDNGIGIPQKAVDKIFQPFFTTKPTGQGTGLGLSLSYDIMKAHGGELMVNSAEVEGAVFIVQLPLSNHSN